KINAWNHERLFEQQDDNTIVFDAITTGNYGGFDAWLEVDQPGDLIIATNLGGMTMPLGDVGFEDCVMEAGGLERRITVFRLPDENPCREIEEKVEIPLAADRDNPLWICLNTEDGFQAWSSPIYVFK
ncbi:MAG: DUF3604 domain-containing protein, partial [Rhodospirillaceae bacterium]|nr:DUF3604 domain-containing protein [Rhodospirillaceae bacterium]